MSEPTKFAIDQFPVKPICEICKKEVANSFVPFATTKDGKDTDWKFCCGCIEEDEYSVIILIDDFYDNPGSTTEELAELHRRGTDWNDFMAMMVRFQEATLSFDR